MDEEWRPVPGWEALYEISSEKRVRSLPRETAKGTLGGRVLKPLKVKQGRDRVALSCDGEVKRRSIDELFGLAFPELTPGVNSMTDSPHMTHDL